MVDIGRNDIPNPFRQVSQKHVRFVLSRLEPARVKKKVRFNIARYPSLGKPQSTLPFTPPLADF